MRPPEHPIWHSRSYSRKSHRLNHRRGLAVTETAILLPLIVLLLFGSIELANAIFLRQSLTIAAYEGGRAVSRAGATEAQGQARVAEIMQIRNVPEFEALFTPEVAPSTPRGTMLEITVTAPASATSITPLRYLFGADLSYTYRVVRL